MSTIPLVSLCFLGVLLSLHVSRHRRVERAARERERLLQGRRTAQCQRLAHEHNPAIMVQGEGAYLIDLAGTRYLDSRNNVALLGHQHPGWLSAVCAQLARTNTNSRYLHPLRNAFEERLCATLPPSLNVVFMVNSGSEATELALRLARAKTKRTGVVAMEQGYHGFTLAALEASPYKWTAATQTLPSSLLAVLPVDGTLSLQPQQADNLSCFIVESALSVGGVRFPTSPSWLSRTFAQVRELGGICIADEVQVGLGRTGEWFWAFQRDPQAIPDVVLVGKGLGNGYPVAAVVCTTEVATALDAHAHQVFSTYGGNPVACAAALSVLETIATENLQSHAWEMGRELGRELRRIAASYLSTICEVRGTGLFWGIEFQSEAQAAEIGRRMYDMHHILCSCDGAVMVVKPPLCWGREEVQKFCHALGQCVGEVDKAS